MHIVRWFCVMAEPRLVEKLGAALLAALLAAPAWSTGSRLGDSAALPHVGEQARETYLNAFLQSDPHRAFALAPGGAWGWTSEAASAETALNGALESCQKLSEAKCVPYAVDDQRVFDDKAWPTLWGPYKSKAEAGRAPSGKKRGMRFPDLAFAADNGKPLKLSDWRGKATVVHFWGSWCTPCKRELPDLQQLVAQFKGAADIAFVFLPVRENVADARRWLASQHLDLPLYDAGVKNSEDEFLRLAGGGKVKDRDIATVFPTTYVLDKHGIVVFSHTGPISDWGQYAAFLRDVAAKSGK